MILYRGDRNREGRDFVTYGLRMGLRARFSDGGSSRMLDKPGGIVEYVLAHVGWNPGSDEEIFSRYSPAISFSSSLKIAKNYMVGGETLSYERCPFRESEVVLYSLEFEPEELTPTGLDGVGWLFFERSIDSCIPHFQDRCPWELESRDVVYEGSELTA